MPHRGRWLLLLLASCYFYMVFVPMYILILGFIIVIDYIAGLLIENQSNIYYKKIFLSISLFINIGTLVVFKYYNFFNQNLTELLQIFHFQNTLPFLKIALPIGLSFHTFQAMSYTIEVYRGQQKAEKHFGIYALYVLFYPQLVAGPIERPQNVLHQFREKHFVDWERIKSGLGLMLQGFIKKVVIADRLAMVVDAAYADPHATNGLSLAIATFFYAFQIYCDFSGYSDIGIGAARVMGFRLMTNFNAPYLATSVTEFWQRWHISLSSWFRDYVYIPLGGNRVGIKRWIFNIWIVFIISGLWHGAKWNFLIWGALHGLYLIIERLKHIGHIGDIGHIGRYIKKSRIFKACPYVSYVTYVSYVFNFILICLTWIFFRAETVDKAFLILRKVVIKISIGHPIQSPLNPAEMIFAVGLIIGLLFSEKYNLKIAPQSPFFWIYFAIGVLFCYLFGIFGQTQFIYFQF
jgi:D-alanyl-lipoteichoic acid acyltransferase DltB (MBOAT superfamily)